ncbi:MAG: ABC transporter permease, partial [Coriobacteriia bacterium]|nr:ABC transporter permease [Coriobacteriia bacterium]
MSTQLKLAGRYLAGRKLRTALTTLAIVLGVMIIFGLNGVLPGMMELMQRSMLASVGEVDLTVENASSGLFPAEVAEEVAGVEGIAAATPVLRRTVALPPEPDYGTANVSVIGIAPDTAGEVRAFPVAEGRMLTEADDVRGSERPAAVLTASTAEETGLSVGDALQMPAASGTVTFEVVGTIDTPAAAGAQEVYVPLATAQEMFETPGLVTAVDAAFAASVERSAVEAGVQDALGDGYVIGAIAADSPLVAGFAAAEGIMNLIGVFVLAMGGFVILNTFRTMVAERRHDIGMLRAIGASRRTILGLFLTESLVQGLLGTGLGLLAGWGFAAMAARTLGGIVEDLVHMGSFDLVFPLEAWVLSISLGVGITVLSAILPARAASRITPLDALRPQIGDVYEKAATRRAWVGLALIAIAVAALVSRDAGLTGLGVILLLVGMALGASAAVKPVSDRFSRAIELVYRTEGGLARANLQRNPGRAGATASAVMISIGLVVATMSLTSAVVGGYEEYAEKATGSDFIVLPQSFMFSGGAVGAGPELAEEIAATDGIGDVATLRYAPGMAGDLTIQVIGIDPAAYGRIASFRYAEGSSDADLARLSEPGMLLANG